MGEMSKEIRSEINSDGLLTLSISSSEIPKPKDFFVHKQLAYQLYHRTACNIVKFQ